jgi:dihydropteroate synthase
VTSPGQAVLAGLPVGGASAVVLMGALNVSPESFYSGSVHGGADALVAAALAMVEAGAAVIDVGARSTAPYGRTALSVDEERARLARAVEALAARLPVPVSADTTRAEVAGAALEAGARIVNDVSGLRDPGMGPLASRRRVSLVLMASPAGDAPGDRRPGPPAPVATVRRLLEDALARARAAGIPDERVVLDPGIGFFRDAGWPGHEWDARVLAGLASLTALGRPLCVGVSRKSFLAALTGRDRPEGRLAGSLAAATAAVLHGAAMVRTHDVAETRDAVRVAERLRDLVPR